MKDWKQVDRVRRVLYRSMRDGEDATTVVSRVRDAFDSAEARERARRIARTELVGPTPHT